MSASRRDIGRATVGNSKNNMPNNFPANVTHMPSLQMRRVETKNEHLFTFKPIKSLQFIDNNSFFKISGNNDSSLSKLVSAANQRHSNLIDSTTAGDSFKKSINSFAKNRSKAFNTVKSDFETDNRAYNASPLKDSKTNLGSFLKQKPAARTHSLNLCSMNNLLASAKLKREFEFIDSKIDQLKNGNNCGQRILNVALSKNYILSYKQLDNSELSLNAKPVAVESVSRKCSISPPDKRPLRAIHACSARTSFLLKTAQCSQDHSLKRLTPQTLTDFYDKQVSQSEYKTGKAKPLVFDFCKHIELKSGRSLFAGSKSNLNSTDSDAFNCFTG